MPNVRAAHSSDLETARALSLDLANAREPARVQPPAQPAVCHDYVRFPDPRPKTPALPRVPALNFRALEGAGSTHWNEFLDWVLQVVRARAAFVVDAHGLTIAARGEIGPDALESIGARLTLAFDQTDLLRTVRDHKSSLLVELDVGWLSGMRIPVELGGRLLLGVLGTAPIDLQLRDELVRVLEAAFACPRERC